MNISTETTLFQYLTIFEIALNISTYFLAGACFYIFLKYPLFHTNFIRLVKCMVVYYIVSQISRLIIAFHEVFNEEDLEFYNSTRNYLIINGETTITILGYLRLSCLAAAFGATGCVTLERTYATIMLKTYEKSVSNLLFILSFGYQIALGCIGAYGIYHELVNLIMAGAFVLSGNLTGCLWLYFLEKVNIKRHYTSLINPKMYCLSERFQLQENVKTSKMIRRVASILCVFNFLIGSFICASYYYNSNFIQQCSYMFFQISLSIYGYSFALMGITADPLWFQNFKRLITPSLRRKQVAPVDTIENEHRKNLGKKLLTYNGKRMIFTIDEERDVYFNELNNRWNK